MGCFRTRRVCRTGFSLVEILIVISIIAILSGLVTPYVAKNLEQKRREKAISDLDGIAKALMTFFSCQGIWPAMDGSGSNNALKVLITGGTVPTSNPWLQNHEFWTWASGQYGDLLLNHLIGNSPKGQQTNKYSTTGRFHWCGPYIDYAALDPWGHPYIVNIISGYSSDSSLYRKLWVLSAGEDGIIQTSSMARASDEISDNDIGLLIQQR